MFCFTPSDLLDSIDAGLFGNVAESVISLDYLNFVGRRLAFPMSTTEFIDEPDAFQTVTKYISFLKLNNPVASVAKMSIRDIGGKVMVPDIVTHDKLKSIFEFYEIKPGSTWGIVGGDEKIASVHAFCHAHGLPYVPGTRYKPNKDIRLFKGSALGVKIELFLRVRRSHIHGLVVYRVCVDGSGWLPEEVLAAAAAAAIIALIAATRGRILKFSPA